MNQAEALRPNDSQDDAFPEGFVGIAIEGPSREGFLFYPCRRLRGGHGTSAVSASPPHIYPDGASHDWKLRFDPAGAGGRGRIEVSLDGKTAALDLDPGARAAGDRFDHFGIVTTWIDGNSQSVYWDDITYTVGQ